MRKQTLYTFPNNLTAKTSEKMEEVGSWMDPTTIFLLGMPIFSGGENGCHDRPAPRLHPWEVCHVESWSLKGNWFWFERATHFAWRIFVKLFYDLLGSLVYRRFWWNWKWWGEEDLQSRFANYSLGGGNSKIFNVFYQKRWGRFIFTQLDLVAHIFLVGVGEKPPTISSFPQVWELFQVTISRQQGAPLDTR